jgi:hypothetical protein
MNNEMSRGPEWNNREQVTEENSRLDVIRKSVHYWYEQLFAHVGGWSMSISQNDAGEDIFNGVYDYQIDVHLRGIMTDETYTVIDEDTDEEICFAIDNVDHVKYDHLERVVKFGGKVEHVLSFESEMIDDLYTEFVDGVIDPDYDVYERYWKAMPDGTYEFIGGD